MESVSENEKNKPIGIFDSGLGGLTTVKAIKSIMPNEDIIYFGDTGRVPYGSKSPNIIIDYANQDVSFLKSMNVKIIVSACGTVSSYIKNLKNPELVTGVITPSCQSAVNLTKNNRIGVIGTSATIKSEAYLKEIKKICPQAEVFQKDCPLLVPLIENGFIDSSSEILCKTVKMYMKTFIDAKVDTLILGCTHYPIIKSVIAKEFENPINLVNSGEETAKFIKKILKEKNLLSEKETSGKYNFYVSDRTSDFSKTAKIFLGYDIKENVKKIDINKY